MKTNYPSKANQRTSQSNGSSMKIQIPKAVQKPMMSLDLMTSSGQMIRTDQTKDSDQRINSGPMRSSGLMMSLGLKINLGLTMDSSLDNLKIRSAFRVDSDSTMTKVMNLIGTMKSTTNFLVKTNT